MNSTATSVARAGRGLLPILAFMLLVALVQAGFWTRLPMVFTNFAWVETTIAITPTRGTEQFGYQPLEVPVTGVYAMSCQHLRLPIEVIAIDGSVQLRSFSCSVVAPFDASQAPARALMSERFQPVPRGLSDEGWFETTLLSSRLLVPYTRLPLSLMVYVVQLALAVMLCVAVRVRFGLGELAPDKIRSEWPTLTFLVLAPGFFSLALGWVLHGQDYSGTQNVSIPAIEHRLAAIAAYPLLEELIYRGWMATVLDRYFGKWVAVGATTILFALMHPLTLSFGSLIVLVSGICFALLWLKYRNIWLCVFSHGLGNAVVVAFQYLRP